MRRACPQAAQQRAFIERRFIALDADGDDHLTPVELSRAEGAPPAQGSGYAVVGKIDRLFAKLDANQDGAISSLIWTEYEGDEAEDLSEALEALVYQQAQDEDAFLDAPLEACVERLRADLGLPAANDDPPDGPRPTEIIVHRSSG